MSISQKKPLVHLYLCGGAGINIGRQFYSPIGSERKEKGFADLRTTYIDTSLSNIPKDVTEGFYHITGTDAEPVDGSGMVRATNYRAIKAAMPEILHTYKPGNLNIVVHSSSGGSGSTAGVILAAELLAQGKPVVVMMIGSTKSEKELRNTIDTIKSYHGIVSKSGQPIVALYLENGKESMKYNDSVVRSMIILLAAMWSGENHGMDSQDLINFLNYPKVSKYQPALTGLVSLSGTEVNVLSKGQAVSSVLSFVREGEDADPGMVVGYHSFGTMSQAASEAISSPSPLHLHTVQGYFAPIVQELETKLAELEELYRVNPVQGLTVDGSLMEDDGMVL